MDETLKSVVDAAVKVAMAKATPVLNLEDALFTCPGCKEVNRGISAFIDHRFLETYLPNLKEELKPKPKDLVMECKDGICALVKETIKNDFGLGVCPGCGGLTRRKPVVRGLFTREDEGQTVDVCMDCDREVE